MRVLSNHTGPQAAALVLGATLAYDAAEGRTNGRIVEVELYQRDDPASHSFKPMTPRTEALFGPAGTIYIYFTYGMHYCLNIVLGDGRALLVRAVEPLDGVELMKQRRKTDTVKNLCNGPAKLVQAFGIPKNLNGGNFSTGPLRLEFGKPIPDDQVMAAPRIGISKATDKLWRFYVKDNLFVSR